MGRSAAGIDAGAMHCSDGCQITDVLEDGLDVIYGADIGTELASADRADENGNRARNACLCGDANVKSTGAVQIGMASRFGRSFLPITSDRAVLVGIRPMRTAETVPAGRDGRIPLMILLNINPGLPIPATQLHSCRQQAFSLPSWSLVQRLLSHRHCRMNQQPPPAPNPRPFRQTKRNRETQACSCRVL